jgi:hypothetical protein
LHSGCGFKKRGRVTILFCAARGLLGCLVGSGAGCLRVSPNSLFYLFVQTL